LPAPITPFFATAAINAKRGGGKSGIAGSAARERNAAFAPLGECHNRGDYSEGAGPSRVYYPRSFLKFILLGFLLVSLPLIYALAELILSLDRLASQAGTEVLQAAQAGRTSRLIFEHTSTLERIARQHLILEDSALLDDYAPVRQEFRQAAEQLAALPLGDPQRAALAELTDLEDRLYSRLAANQRTPGFASEIADGYAALADGARAMLAATNQITQRAVERLQETAAQGREKWLYFGLATVGIALVLAIVFALLIARPIGQLDAAVRLMGTADFTQAVSVSGPQDLRYLGQRLEWLRARLAELEQQQTRFLRHVSHELKTPLTAVREGIELLRDNVGGRLSPEQHDIVRIVRENTLQLQKLIEDLLAYHQTRAMEPAALGPVAMTDVVSRVVREQKLAALGRMISFQTDLAPAVVVGDAERLRTIVDNLVSNAIKYSPRSGVIGLRLATENSDAVLDVIDDGPGIRPNDRDRIFESFYQGPAPIEGRVKGSGLGLAIAREYAAVHGGAIELRDRPDGGRGACFRLRLPLAGGAGAARGGAPKVATLADAK
jgi:two-component system sensor histidine kinase GlrK